VGAGEGSQVGIMKEKIKKLPKWAQEIIRNLERERAEAINTLNRYVDDQTESPFYSDDSVSTGETQGPTTKRKYFQAYRMNIKHNGVSLGITLRDNIELKWEDDNRDLKEVAFVPTSFQTAELVSKENMRQ
jgi:hypothetical protein